MYIYIGCNAQTRPFKTEFPVHSHGPVRTCVLVYNEDGLMCCFLCKINLANQLVKSFFELPPFRPLLADDVYLVDYI